MLPRARRICPHLMAPMQLTPSALQGDACGWHRHQVQDADEGMVRTSSEVLRTLLPAPNSHPEVPTQGLVTPSVGAGGWLRALSGSHLICSVPAKRPGSKSVQGEPEIREHQAEPQT